MGALPIADNSRSVVESAAISHAMQVCASSRAIEMDPENWTVR